MALLFAFFDLVLVDLSKAFIYFGFPIASVAWTIFLKFHDRELIKRLARPDPWSHDDLGW